MSAPCKPGDLVSFTFVGGLRFEAVKVYASGGALYATTDSPRYGDGPCDILLVHISGKVNRNVTDLRVVGA